MRGFWLSIPAHPARLALAHPNRAPVVRRSRETLPVIRRNAPIAAPGETDDTQRSGSHRLITAAGTYVPYEQMVERAARELVMSAERAGAYKIDPRAYQAALDALGLPAERVPFVAGSDHDVTGASVLDMAVCWSNRQALSVPDGPEPLVNAPDLTRLPDLLA